MSEKIQFGLVDYEEIHLSIIIPTGEIIRCIKLFRNLPLKIGDCVFPSDLIEFNLDVILGMNWLSLYKANIDCEIQKVELRNPLGKLTSYRPFGKP